MAAPDAASPADGFCNVYVSSLPNSFTSGDLYKLFSPHGYLLSARCMQPKDKSSTAPHYSIPNSDEHRGYGFVCFRDSLDAARAVQAMAGASVDGVRIQVRPSRRDVPPATNVSWGERGGSATPTSVLRIGGTPSWQCAGTSTPPLMAVAPAATTTFAPIPLAAPSVSHPLQLQQQQPQSMLTASPLTSASPQHPIFLESRFPSGAPATFCHAPPSAGATMPSPTAFLSPVLGSGSSSSSAHCPTTAEGTPTLLSTSSQLSPFFPMLNHTSSISAPQYSAPSPLYYVSPSGSFACMDSPQSSGVPMGGGVPLHQPPQLHHHHHGGGASVAHTMPALMPPYMDPRFSVPPPSAQAMAVALPSQSLSQVPFNAYSRLY